MSGKKLNTGPVMNELKGHSAFFDKSKSPTRPQIVFQEKKDITHKVTDLQTPKVTESETHRVTDFESYIVPDYRQLQRLELRLTWDQKEYLDRLEALITRDMPEGERSDPNYKRITKNSIVRGLVEILRRLNLSIDASHFKSEKDLTKELFNKLTHKLTELLTDRPPKSENSKVTE